jgi:hypothetical protein
MSRPTAKFLKDEGKRNRANADLFRVMLCIAWGEDCEIIVGHHINFQFDKDFNTEDEIPAADTLLFDHEIMHAVFGDKALGIMRTIATLAPYEREEYVGAVLRKEHPTSDFTIQKKAA